MRPSVPTRTTRRIFRVLVVLAALGCAIPAWAISYESAGSGDWNAAATWTPAGVPGTADDVSIGATHVITLTQDESANNLTCLETTGTNLQGAFTLSVYGTLTGSTTSPPADVITSTIKFAGGGTGTRALFATWGPTTTGLKFEIALDSGATGTFTGDLAAKAITMTSGTLDVTGQLRPDSSAANSGTLTINGGSMVLSDILTRTGTTNTPFASFTMTGGTFKTTSASADVWPSAVTTSFAAGSTVEYAGASQTMQTATYGNLVTSGSGTKTPAGGVDVEGTFRTSAGLVNGNNLTFNGTFQIDAGGIITGAPTYGPTSTLRYNTGGTFGRGDEWTSTDPANVQISNSTTLDYPNGSLLAARTLTGNLTIDTGSALSMDFGSPNPGVGGLMVGGDVALNGSLSLGNLSGGDLHIGGNFTRIGTLTPNGRTVEFTGSVAKSITGATGFDFLTISNTGGITLNNDVTVNQTLALGGNTITTGANTVTANSAVTQSGSGRVAGLLRKPVSSATTYAFEIGDASTYAPASVAVSSLGGGGTLTASTAVLGGAPVVASGLSASTYVNRRWTLTNSGITSPEYSATFTFVPGDIVGSATTSNLIVAKNTSGTWSNPTVGARTSTSTEATGLTAFSDFELGEPIPTWTLTYTAGANGTLSGTSPQTVNHGADGTAVTAVADAGSHFVTWSDGVLTAARTDLGVTANISASASFALNTYTITATAGANGTIAPLGVSAVNYGDTPLYTITPTAGFHVADVVVDAASVGAVTSYTFPAIAASHTIAASFASNGVDLVTVGPAASAIAIATPCVVVPVSISRTDPAGLQSYAVTVQLSANLAVCGGGIAAGSYLGGVGPTSFSVLDNGGGSYTVTQILTAACGATGDGTLFTIPLSSGTPTGSGSVTITAASVSDCASVALPTTSGTPAAITIDQVAPVAASSLTAVDLTTGNDSDGTIKITLAFDAPGDAAGVEVYRAGFGGYPRYDDAGGSVPATPSYPPGAPWVLTGVTASGQTDEPATRDSWYYVAFVKDAVGNVSPVSVRVGGVLSYHTGDVSNGITAGDGNNVVNTADLSLLGAHYGLTGAAMLPFDYLDIGPSADGSVHGRPLTDQKVTFEDLILFAINFSSVSAPVNAPVNTPSSILPNVVWLSVPRMPAVGEEFTVPVMFRGAGSLQGASVQFGYDTAKVAMLGVDAGGLLAQQQAPAAVFSSGAGDVDIALLGPATLEGEGDVAQVHFRVTAAGDPAFHLLSMNGRDGANHDVPLTGVATVEQSLPKETSLALLAPNPARVASTVRFALHAAGAVRLAVYDIAGRCVATLLDGPRNAGVQSRTWNLRDAAGRRVGTGLYLVRLEAAGKVYTRRMQVVR